MSAALGATLLAIAGPAAASAGPGTRWRPYHTQGEVLAAGDVCPFELSEHVVSDKERYRTTATFADGSPRYQEFTGQLIMRFTNDATGASVVRNLTGRGDFEYLPDGSIRFSLVGGSFSIGLHRGDEPGPAYDVVTGSDFVVHIGTDGQKTMTAGDGTVENICATLG